MQLSHDPMKISACFDDPNLVSRAGGAGGRADSPHRPGSSVNGVQARCPRHDRGEGHGAEGEEGQSSVLDEGNVFSAAEADDIRGLLA